jgi:copper chaperone CopZ
METLELTVTGMTCGGCENAVKRAVSTLAGVESVAASHTANHVTVSVDPAKVGRAQLTQKIETLGDNVAA